MSESLPAPRTWFIDPESERAAPSLEALVAGLTPIHARFVRTRAIKVFESADEALESIKKSLVNVKDDGTIEFVDQSKRIKKLEEQREDWRVLACHYTNKSVKLEAEVESLKAEVKRLTDLAKLVVADEGQRNHAAAEFTTNLIISGRVFSESESRALKLGFRAGSMWAEKNNIHLPSCNGETK